MRKRIRIVFLAALVAAIIVPLGFALSTESVADRATSSAHGVVPFSQVVMVHPHTPVVASTGAAATTVPEVPEGAKLLAIGTALFGVAAAMRRTSKRL